MYGSSSSSNKGTSSHLYFLSCRVRDTVGDSGLCCCVHAKIINILIIFGPCDVFRALIVSLSLLILHKCSWPHSVSNTFMPFPPRDAVYRGS